MNIFRLIEGLRHDTLEVSLPSFGPELAICATIVLMLLARMPRWGWRFNALWIALPGSLVALGLAAPWIHLETHAARHVGTVQRFEDNGKGVVRLTVADHGLSTGGAVEVATVEAGANRHQVDVVDADRFDLRGSSIDSWSPDSKVYRLSDVNLHRETFTGMLVHDRLGIYFRSVLLVFLSLFLVFTRLSGIPDREDSPDFYTLVFGATLGMCVMVSSNHLFMVFLGVEMASVPSFALVGILKGRRKSSEAALKYAIYGAGAAGVMLYGISLLAGALGSVHMPTMAVQLASLSAEQFAERQSVLMLGGLMLMVGLAYKLSAVPFHFWCPDAFEGASAEVNAFLSVASKAAALALLVRVGLGLTTVAGGDVAVAAQLPAAQFASAEQATGAVRLAVARQPEVADESAVGLAPLTKARHFAAGLIGLLAAVTCTFGNLAAYGQTNIKRLLAYSTIAHAGYMMMPIAAAVALAGERPELAEQAVSAVALYVGLYLFMNLGVFAIVAFLRNTLRSEEIADYAGLFGRCPGVVICLAVILFSLIGLPPLAGFVAKYAAFLALASAGMWLLLFIGGLNTVLSLFYYLRVVRVMTMEPEPADRLPVSFSLISPEGVYVALVTVPVVVLGIWWDPLSQWARAATEGLLS